MSLPSTAQFDIETLISVAQPHSILMLGHDFGDIARDYVSQQAVLGVQVEVAQVSAQDWQTVLQQPKLFDLAIVSQVIEHESKALGRQLLAALRDQLSRQYCVYLALNDEQAVSQWQLSDMLSMALVRVNEYPQESSHHALFKYSIASYKRTPDWLNPDNWANPELWGKYWW